MTPQVLSTVGEHAAAGRSIGGSLLWMAAANSYPDHDGTTIYLAPAAQPAAGDAEVVAALRRHAADMAALPSASLAAVHTVAARADAPEKCQGSQALSMHGNPTQCTSASGWLVAVSRRSSCDLLEGSQSPEAEANAWERADQLQSATQLRCSSQIGQHTWSCRFWPPVADHITVLYAGPVHMQQAT